MDEAVIRVVVDDQAKAQQPAPAAPPPPPRPVAPPPPPSTQPDDFAARQRQRMAAQDEKRRREAAEDAKNALPEYKGGYEPVAPPEPAPPRYTHLDGLSPYAMGSYEPAAPPPTSQPLPVKVVETIQKPPTTAPPPGAFTDSGLPGSELYKRRRAEAEAAIPTAAPYQPPGPEGGRKPKGTLDNLLDAAQAARGAIGGSLGRAAGAALDFTSYLRSTKPVAPPPPPNIPPPPPPPTFAPPVAKLVPPPPPPGAMAGLATGVLAAGAAGAIVAELSKAISGMADKAAEYSPAVAQEQAFVELKAMLGDMRRARENEGELVEFLKAQSELQQKWEGVKAAVMKKIIPVVSGILEVLAQLLGIASQRDVEEIEDPTTTLLKDGLKTPEF